MGPRKAKELLFTADSFSAQEAHRLGMVNQVVRLAELQNTALQLAQRKAIHAGADPVSLRTIEIEDMPIAYLPGNSLRVRVRVAGALDRIETKREVA